MSIMLLTVKSKSCTDYFINARDWLKGVDSQCYVCECDYFQRLLKFNLSKAGRHVCVVAYAAELKKDVPPCCSFESVCLPGYDELCVVV